MYLKTAILLVNGQFDYKDRLWLEISLANIIGCISAVRSFKVFIWNNNYDNQHVMDYAAKYGDQVEILDANRFDLQSYDLERNFRLSPGEGGTMAGGFHPHSTPLQILYEHATASYDIDVIFTFDNDSCPIRANWDIPLVYALDQGKKITGIWRDEMKMVIDPYIHPSCLGIKVSTIRELGLRFNELQVVGKQDTLSQFTRTVAKKYGQDNIFPFKRNNRLQYHPVFNGIYGTLVYHHHLGTRNREGASMFLRSYGWKERNERMIENRLVMDATTEMVFRDDVDFFNTLAYGHDYLKYRVYLHYYRSNPSKFRACKLFHHARLAYKRDRVESFFILTLILKELEKDKKFMEFYIKVCDDLGFAMEANAYRGILSGEYTIE